MMCSYGAYECLFQTHLYIKLPKVRPISKRYIKGGLKCFRCRCLPYLHLRTFEPFLSFLFQSLSVVSRTHYRNRWSRVCLSGPQIPKLKPIQMLKPCVHIGLPRQFKFEPKNYAQHCHRCRLIFYSQGRLRHEPCSAIDFCLSSHI